MYLLDPETEYNLPDDYREVMDEINQEEYRDEVQRTTERNEGQTEILQVRI